MAEAPTLDLVIECGADFHMRARLWEDEVGGTPRDLTGLQAELMIRAQLYGPEIVTPTITVDEPEGIIDIDLTHAQTAAIQASRGLYDLFLVEPGAEPEDPPVAREKLLKGRITFSPAVTR